MVMITVKSPVCGGEDITKNGKNRNEVQRYLCNAKECMGKSFIQKYSYNGCKAGIEKQIIEMTANASGIKDIRRVLKVTKGKVSST